MAARIKAALEKLDLELNEHGSDILYPDGHSIAEKDALNWEKSIDEFHDLMYKFGVWT